MDRCRLFRKDSQGDEEGVSPSLSMLMTRWSVWSCTLGWMRSSAYGSGLKGGQGHSGVCYRPPDQKDRADEALHRQVGAALYLQAQFKPSSLWGTSNILIWVERTTQNGIRNTVSWNIYAVYFTGLWFFPPFPPGHPTQHVARSPHFLKTIQWEAS